MKGKKLQFISKTEGLTCVEQTLVLVDGSNLISRMYFATSYGKDEKDLWKSEQGYYTNALGLFFQKITSLVRQYNATHLVIAWDVKGEDTKRKKKYDFYKGTRSAMPEPLIQQFKTAKRILKASGVAQLEVPLYEADDIIGTLSAKWSQEKRGKCFLYSNDKDLFQLLNESTVQIVAKNSAELMYTNEAFEKDYQIKTNQWADAKALLGDKSDNIPGVKGVGDKAAYKLLNAYQSIENIYENLDEVCANFKRYEKALREGKESAFISKDLAVIEQNMDAFTSFEWNELEVALNYDKLYECMDYLQIKFKRAN